MASSMSLVLEKLALTKLEVRYPQCPNILRCLGSTLRPCSSHSRDQGLVSRVQTLWRSEALYIYDMCIYIYEHTVYIHIYIYICTHTYVCIYNMTDPIHCCNDSQPPYITGNLVAKPARSEALKHPYIVRYRHSFIENGTGPQLIQET